MRNKILFFVVTLFFGFTFFNVNASSSVELSLSCPSVAKTNTTVVCKLYGSSTESEIDSVEAIDVKPTGAIRSVSYLIDYNNITVGSPKNIGNITVKTGNVGTGYIEVVFNKIHFVDDIQLKASVSKKIIINSTGVVTNQNTVVSGDSSNNSANSNSINNTDTHLKDIKLSRGILSPSFSKNVYKYSVKVDSNVDKISIDGVKNAANQLIEGEVNGQTLKYGKNVFKLVVSNGSSTKRIYEIIIDREDNRDTNNLLSSISLSSGNIKFSPEVYEYETKVLYNITELSILATPEKATSTVKIDGQKNLKVGENVITITVKAEKGNTKKYIIKVNRLNEGEQLGDNSNIKNIIVSGYDLGFDYSKQSYELLIKKEDKLNISVIMDDPNASYQIIGNDDLKDGSVISIVTKSFDGTSTQTYNIEITKPKYTVYYVLAGSLIALTIMMPLLFYFKYVKTKKQLVDINGNKIGKEDLSNGEYRKIIDFSSSNNYTENNSIGNQGSLGMNNEKPQYVVNVGEYNNQNSSINNVTEDGMCPKCGRELLGSPSICPYCNNILR